MFTFSVLINSQQFSIFILTVLPISYATARSRETECLLLEKSGSAHLKSDVIAKLLILTAKVKNENVIIL